MLNKKTVSLTNDHQAATASQDHPMDLRLYLHGWTNRQVVRLPQSMLLLFVYLASVNQNKLELTRPMEGLGTQGLKAHGLTLQDHKV